MRNRVNALIRSAKRRHYQNKFSNSQSPACTSALVNDLRGVCQTKNISDSLTRDFGRVTFSTVKNFNEFFAQFSRKKPPCLPISCSLSYSNMATAFLPRMDDLDLRSIIFSFRKHKAPSFDGIKVDDLRRNFDMLQGAQFFKVLTAPLSFGLYRLTESRRSLSHSIRHISEMTLEIIDLFLSSHHYL